MSTESRRHYIQAWYKNGKSAAEIARILSQQEQRLITRNAVIGVARRAGLCQARTTEAHRATALSPTITLPLGQVYCPRTRQLSPKWPEPLNGGRNA